MQALRAHSLIPHCHEQRKVTAAHYRNKNHENRRLYPTSSLLIIPQRPLSRSSLAIQACHRRVDDPGADAGAGAKAGITTKRRGETASTPVQQTGSGERLVRAPSPAVRVEPQPTCRRFRNGNRGHCRRRSRQTGTGALPCPARRVCNATTGIFRQQRRDVWSDAGRGCGGGRHSLTGLETAFCRSDAIIAASRKCDVSRSWLFKAIAEGAQVSSPVHLRPGTRRAEDVAGTQARGVGCQRAESLG